MLRFDPIGDAGKIAKFLGMPITTVIEATADPDTHEPSRSLILAKLRNIGCSVDSQCVGYKATAVLKGDPKQLQCEQCGRFMSFSDGYLLNGFVTCSNCYHRKTTRCLWCGTSTGGSALCSDCSRDQRKHHGAFWDPPSFKQLRMPHESETSAVYGVEAEVDGRDLTGTKTIRTINAIIDNTGPEIWAKRDGSLSAHGMELVTHPLSAEYHLKVFAWENVEEILIAQGYTRTSPCGLHIHMSRHNLNTTQQVKMGVFWYTHRKFIEKFSRRRMGRYCHGKSGKDCIKRRKRYGGGSKYGFSSHSGRRHSVNFGAREGIEFRQFNGTYKAQTIRASVMFLEHLRKFARINGSAYLTTKQAKDDFLEVLRNSKSKDLRMELQERGL